MRSAQLYRGLGSNLTLYCAWLQPSLSDLQVLDEFYQELRSGGVAALTGEGVDDFFAGVLSCGKDYHMFYKPDLDMRKQVGSGIAVIYCCSRLNWNTSSRFAQPLHCAEREAQCSQLGPAVCATNA